MSNQKLVENLKVLTQLHGGLSVSDLARETKIPQPTLHHIFEGKTKNPRSQTLKALADFFSIAVPQLTGSLPLPVEKTEISDSFIARIPLIKWEEAQNWPFNEMNSSHFKSILIDKKVGKNTFALELLEAKMEPMFPEHSILIFDPEKEPKDRDFVLAYISKMNELLFNRLFVENKIYYVKNNSENGDVKLVKLAPPNDRLIAVLIEARQEF